MVGWSALWGGGQVGDAIDGGTLLPTMMMGVRVKCSPTCGGAGRKWGGQWGAQGGRWTAGSTSPRHEGRVGTLKHRKIRCKRTSEGGHVQKHRPGRVIARGPAQRRPGWW